MARKSYNQIVILQVFKAANKKPGQAIFSAFISLISLDYIGKDQILDKMVQVHPVTYERASTNGYGIEATKELQFPPNKLSLNHSESSFVLYGDRSIFVGNFPSMLQNLSQKRTDSK